MQCEKRCETCCSSQSHTILFAQCAITSFTIGEKAGAPPGATRLPPVFLLPPAPINHTRPVGRQN